ncbi:MAG: GIY-YIG nuclease family protein [Gemmatimonadota bacterium]
MAPAQADNWVLAAAAVQTDAPPCPPGWRTAMTWRSGPAGYAPAARISNHITLSEMGSRNGGILKQTVSGLMRNIDKEHILDEIRRTTAENGGEPVGFRRFASETGIRQADWLGKHWARWSDAVLAAGLSPNELKTGYGEEALLARFFDLARELGRLPTQADLKLKRAQTNAFPGADAFQRRFKSKGKLVEQLRDYCADQPDRHDVLALCSQYLSTLAAGPRRVVDAEMEIGFVYLIRSGKHFKIGKSNAAGRRERELAIQLPERTTTVHVIRTDDPTGIEAYWHKRFESKRRHGEWFELDSNDVAAFKRRKFM